jgi:hypothetical protein
LTTVGYIYTVLTFEKKNNQEKTRNAWSFNKQTSREIQVCFDMYEYALSIVLPHSEVYLYIKAFGTEGNWQIN